MQMKKNNCAGLLTKSECRQALKYMKPEKIPVSDGIPAEFYKIFWNDISEHLVTSIKHAYQKSSYQWLKHVKDECSKKRCRTISY